MELTSGITFVNRRLRRTLIAIIVMLALMAGLYFFWERDSFFFLWGLVFLVSYITQDTKYVLDEEKIAFYGFFGRNETGDIYVEDILNVFLKNNSLVVEYQTPRSRSSQTHRFSLAPGEALKLQEELVKRNPDIEIE